MPPHSDSRVDAYIAQAAPFARPVLERLRADVHAACPGVTEAIKWSMPFFMHGGRNLAHMAAFKAHCAFGFELGRAVVDLGREAQAMGQFGRITSLADLPSSAEIRRLVKKAADLIDAGARPPRAPKSNPRGTAVRAASKAVARTAAATAPAARTSAGVTATARARTTAGSRAKAATGTARRRSTAAG